ncbi:MAG: glycosyltransferase family 4 protein [Pirellulales bacterium]
MKNTERSHRRVAVLFHRLGPYHCARLQAATESGHVSVIEISAKSRDYSWDRCACGPEVDRRVVADDDANVSPRELTKRIRHELDSIAPDAVFVPGWSGTRAYAPLGWCLDHKVPAILMSETTHLDDRRNIISETIKSRVLHCFSAALVGGTPHRSYLENLGFPAKKIALGYDAVDNNYFSDAATQARLRARELQSTFNLPMRYFLVSSRFIPKKNLEAIIRAYKGYVKAEVGDVQHLVIIGDGPLQEPLEQLVRSLGLNELVHFPGFVQYNNLPKYYAFATALIHGSLTEQWGLVVNEAMASGIPVIVSRTCGCVHDLVQDGMNGRLFDPRDVSCLTKIIASLAADPERGTRFGEAGRAIISQWGPKRFAQGFWEAVDIAFQFPYSRRSLDGLCLSVAAYLSQFSRVS